MKFSQDINNVKFEGRTKDSRDEYFHNKKKNMIKNLSKENANFKTEFQKLMQDGELYEEIKIKLRNARQLVNQTKLNKKK